MTVKLEELCETVAAYLAPRLKEADLTGEYPAARRGHPLLRPVVAVGVEEIRLERGGLSQYLGVDEEGNEQFGQRARLTLRFDILCPAKTGGCHKLFVALCQYLLLEEGPVQPRGMSCGKLEYDRMADGLHLTGKGTVEAALVRGGSDGAIREITIIRRDG